MFKPRLRLAFAFLAGLTVVGGNASAAKGEIVGRAVQELVRSLHDTVSASRAGIRISFQQSCRDAERNALTSTMRAERQSVEQMQRTRTAAPNDIATPTPKAPAVCGADPAWLISWASIALGLVVVVGSATALFRWRTGHSAETSRTR